MSDTYDPVPQGGAGGADEPEPTGPKRVIGTPSPAPRAVDAKAVEPQDAADYVPTDPADMQSAKVAERVAAAFFVLAFLAGVGFLAAYIGLEVGPNHAGNAVVAALRSNLALGTSLGVALLSLGVGSMIWVRHLTPNIEIEEHRHELKSAPDDRAAFQKDFAEGAAITQITKRPLLRRTMLLATAPLALAPLWLLRDLGPLPGTILRHTVCRRSVCGSGPRSRSSTSGATASGSVASSIVRRSSGLRVTWEIAAPSANSRWKAARSAGADGRSCRSSSISMFGVRCRTQIIEPVPSASSATASELPSARFERSAATTALAPFGIVAMPTSRPT